MVELKEIEDAHSKVESGADFPKYIQQLKKLGITMYSSFVNDGHTVFTDADDHQLTSPKKYSLLRIANISDRDRFKHYLKNHQRGQSDYSTFCSNAAETGVEKWIVDMNKMTCTYYDKANNTMLEEMISIPL